MDVFIKKFSDIFAVVPSDVFLLDLSMIPRLIQGLVLEETKTCFITVVLAAVWYHRRLNAMLCKCSHAKLLRQGKG